MHARDNLHSLIVAWLKVLLPLTALAILSTVFLIAGNRPAAEDLPYADGDIERMAQGPQLDAPTYASVADNGAAIRVSADRATPVADDPDALAADALSARIEMPGGEAADITAAAGDLDGAGGRASLQGGVTVTTTSGYRLETEALSAGLGNATARTEGPVTGDGPLGEVRAGRMTLGPGGTGGGHRMSFTDGVRVIYAPGTDR